LKYNSSSRNEYSNLKKGKLGYIGKNYKVGGITEQKMSPKKDDDLINEDNNEEEKTTLNERQKVFMKEGG